MPCPPSWANWSPSGPLGLAKIADLVAADVLVLLQARPGEGEVHVHRHLAGFEGVDALAHVAVGRAGRRAAIVERLVEFEPFDGLVGVDEAFHLVRLVGVFVFEAEAVEHVHGAHGDAFRAALGVDRGAVDGLAVDLALLEELGDLLQLVEGGRRGQIPAVLLLEFLLQLGLGEPVLAVGPADDVAHGRQRPVVRRVLRPFRIADDGRRHEVIHRDAFLGEEVVELDVVAVLGRAADPLAVADDQVAQLALGIQLVEEAVGIVGPRHELELHADAGFLGEVLGQFDQRVGRVPCGPAQRQIFGLRDSRDRASTQPAPTPVRMPFSMSISCLPPVCETSPDDGFKNPKTLSSGPKHRARARPRDV